MFFDEDIGWFDIPVYDELGCEVLESLVDLAYNGPYFFLGHGAAFPESFFQIAAVAELGDEVAVVGALEYLCAADDVGMVQASGDADLLLEQLL